MKKLTPRDLEPGRGVALDLLPVPRAGSRADRQEGEPAQSVATTSTMTSGDVAGRSSRQFEQASVVSSVRCPIVAIRTWNQRTEERRWSKALTYQLKPGCYAEYKKAHDEVWPELAQAMSDNQVNMVIHHHEERLYLYMTSPTEEHFDRSHTGEVAERWLAYMATLMITDDEGTTIMEEMDMAFAFGRYKEELDE